MALDPNDPINRIASNQLGPAPQQPEVQQAAVEAAAPPPAETPTEMAMTDAAPQTEADNANQEPFTMIKLKVGDGEREFTKSQLEGMASRYPDVNYKYAQAKPRISVAEQLAATTGKDMQTVMGDMMNLMRNGLSKNTQLGGDGNQSMRPGQDTAPGQSDMGTDDPFASWEAENDVALPPGYREQQKNIAAIQNQIGQIGQMLNGVLQQSQNTAQNAVANNQRASQQREEALQRTVQNNLTEAGQRYNLAEADDEPFMTFIAERGYDMREFTDKDLLNNVMADFAALKNQPEFERLKEINTRRQAYQGTAAATPAQGEAATPASPADETLNRLADKAFSRQAGMG